MICSVSIGESIVSISRRKLTLCADANREHGPNFQLPNTFGLFSRLSCWIDAPATGSQQGATNSPLLEEMERMGLMELDPEVIWPRCYRATERGAAAVGLLLPED